MKQASKQNRLQDLAHRWLNGEITEVESIELNNWFTEGLEAPFEIPEAFALSEAQHKAQLWQQIVAKKQSTSPYRIFKLGWKPFATAAAILLVLGTSIWLMQKDNDKMGNVTLDLAAADVQPGKTGATLTLANGKKIYVTDASLGKLADASGVSIMKTASGQIVYKVNPTAGNTTEYNTLQTANGQQVQVILPDQSTVFLNAGSTIKYPSTFGRQKNRIVELSGEAYFEVAKDKMHPFMVKSSNQVVKVLGTHFNVNAYPQDDKIKTTLLEGSININDSKVLKPGQLAINHKAEITVQEANVSIETAWIDNYFAFDGENTESVMRKIGRWYNVTIDYPTEKLKSIPLNGRISRTKSLAIVLERIGKAANLHFTIKGQSVTVEQQL